MIRRVKVIAALIGFGISLAAFGVSRPAFSAYNVNVRNVAILPFADYTHRHSFPDALKWDGARRITEELSSGFMEHAIAVVPTDAAVKLLLKDGVIRPLEGVQRQGTPEYEILHNVYSQQHTKAIFQRIARKQKETTPLIQAKIIELGKRLGVDAVIRGAIFQYELRPQTVSNPFEGLLPFLMFDGKKRAACYAFAKSYESGMPQKEYPVAIHDYKTEFPTANDTSTIVVVFYVQDTRDGQIIWRDHIELTYPNQDFIPDLKKKISAFIDKMSRRPNGGFVEGGE